MAARGTGWQPSIITPPISALHVARLSQRAEHCFAFVATKRTIKKRAEKTPPVMILVT